MRKLLAIALFTLAGASGCSMCAHPYDDCYPVVHEDSPQADQYGDYAANRQPTSAGGAQSRMTQSRTGSSNTY